MPKRYIDKKKSVTYQLCHKNYDDVTYENEQTKSTLCLRKIGGRTVQHEPDFEREWGLVPTLNMREADDSAPAVDSGPDCIFRDAQWNDFDQDWIRAMCEKPEDESTAVLDMTRYPCHDPKLATSDIDRAFATQMQDFDQDYALEQMDERIQGPLPIEAYEAALDEWIENSRKVTILQKWDGEECEIGAKRPGGTRFEMPTVVKEHIFHMDSKGVYLTVLQSKKYQCPYIDYHRERRDAHALTLQRAAAEASSGEEDEPVDDEAMMEEMFPEKPADPWDCETILSTYSNLENHPEVIREAHQRKIRLSAKTGLPRHSAPIAPLEPTSDDELAERVSVLTSTTSMGRPRDETPEEKLERKKLLKAGKRLRREQKKELQAMFSEAAGTQRWELQRAQEQRRSMPLGGGRTTL